MSEKGKKGESGSRSPGVMKMMMKSIGDMVMALALSGSLMALKYYAMGKFAEVKEWVNAPEYADDP